MFLWTPHSGLESVLNLKVNFILVQWPTTHTLPPARALHRPGSKLDVLEIIEIVCLFV